MAELYYSLTSKKRIFHLAACRYRRRIAVDSLVILDDFSQAADRGLLPCKCCLRVLQRYRSESSQIHRFCRENGIFAELRKITVHIVSACDCRRITADNRRSGMALYHRNTQFRIRQAPSPIAGFHLQPVNCDTIMSYLEYIVSHNRFKIMQRQTQQQAAYVSRKKKRRKKHSENSARKNTIIRVYDLIDKLRAMNSL